MLQPLPKHNTADLALFECDCRDLLRQIESESVDLAITSPPYSMGKEYETGANLDNFINMHTQLFPEIYRILKPGGHICWQIGYHVHDRICEPLDFYVHQEAKKFADLNLRNRIIWTFGHGVHANQRFSGRHETVMWYTKGDDYYFNVDAVRVPQKYPGKKHYKGPKKGQYSGNPAGKNPSDVWEIPNVKARHVEKTEHPCQFPVALVSRLVRALTRPGELVVDPFAGVGTSGVVCALEGRSFVGAETVSRYAQIGRERIAAAKAGKLNYREDNEILDPRSAGSVAIRPAHFEWEYTP